MSDGPEEVLGPGPRRKETLRDPKLHDWIERRRPAASKNITGAIYELFNQYPGRWIHLRAVASVIVRWGYDPGHMNRGLAYVSRNHGLMRRGDYVFLPTSPMPPEAPCIEVILGPEAPHPRPVELPAAQTPLAPFPVSNEAAIRAWLPAVLRYYRKHKIHYSNLVLLGRCHGFREEEIVRQLRLDREEGHIEWESHAGFRGGWIESANDIPDKPFAPMDPLPSEEELGGTSVLEPAKPEPKEELPHPRAPPLSLLGAAYATAAAEALRPLWRERGFAFTDDRERLEWISRWLDDWRGPGNWPPSLRAAILEALRRPGHTPPSLPLIRPSPKPAPGLASLTPSEKEKGLRDLLRTIAPDGTAQGQIFPLMLEQGWTRPQVLAILAAAKAQPLPPIRFSKTTGRYHRTADLESKEKASR